MGQAIGDLLPSAVGVALSPVPIIAVILILGTPKARSNGPAFALGWVLGLVIVSVDRAARRRRRRRPRLRLASTAVDVVSCSSACCSCCWRSSSGGAAEPGEEATMPKWMATVDQFAPGKSLVLGAALSGANPKNLALTPGRRGLDRPGRARRRRERRSPSPCSSSSAR